MEDKGTRIFRITLFSVLLAAFLLGTAWQKDAIAKRKAIKLWATLPMTGPMATHYAPIWYGVNSYWKMVNKNEGGIKGLPVEVVCHDDQYNIQKTLSGYARIRTDPDIVCLTASQSALQEVLKPKLLADKMPLVGAHSIPVNTRPTTQFSPLGDYTLLAEAWIKWFKENWEKEGGKGSMKVGVITQPWGGANDAWVGTQKFARDNGVEIVGKLEVPLMPGEYSAELLKLKSLGANLIFFPCLAGAAIGIMKDAYKLGLTRDIKFLLGGATAGGTIIPKLGQKAVEGLYGIHYGDWNPNTPASKAMVEAVGKYHNWPHYGLEILAPWFYMMVAHAGIEKAAEKVSIEELTHEDVLNGIRDLGKFDTPAGMAGPLDFTEANPTTIGATTACIIRVMNGKWVRYSSPDSLLPLKFRPLDEFKEFRK